jgi:hypothetical protein
VSVSRYRVSWIDTITDGIELDAAREVARPVSSRAGSSRMADASRPRPPGCAGSSVVVARAATGVAGVRGKLVTSGGSAKVGAGNRERRKTKQKVREQRRRVDSDHVPGAVPRQVTPGTAG